MPQSDQLKEQQIEYAAFQASLDDRRSWLLWLGLVGSVTLLSGLVFSLSSEVFDSIDELILLAATATFTLISLCFFIVNERQLYHLVFGWVLVIFGSRAALLVNDLFGAQYDRVLNDHLPLYIGFIPVGIVFACTYLLPRHAHPVVLAYSAFLGLTSVIFFLLHGDEAVSGAGPAFLILTLCLVNPTVIVLMRIHERTRLSAQGRVEELMARERRREHLQERASMTDTQTGCLNSKGCLQELQRYEREHDDDLLLIAIEPGDKVQLDAAKPETSQAYLNTLLMHLRKYLPGFTFARIDNWQFLAWIDTSKHQLNAEILQPLAEQLSQVHLDRMPLGMVHIGVSLAGSQESADEKIQETVFQAFLARSRSQSVLISPVAQMYFDQIAKKDS